MKRFFSVILFFLSLSSLLSAQNIWYFGNGAGLNFSFGHPEPVSDGKLYTLEGCATACDEKGRLLFYTDGVTVWNKHHRVMQNGTGLNGSPSSTQVLIVPQPGSDLYFIFMMDEKAGKNGFSYAVVDLSSAEGSVIKKNVVILASSSEKVTVVRQDAGGFWVIAHQWNSSNFYSFPVTSSGLGAPVYSSVGLYHAETGAGENREAIGCMTASLDGKKIALVTCYREKDNLELFDFDAATGKLSNAFSVTLKGSPYGLCFSPDSKKLYISFLKGRSGVMQYDVSDGTPVQVIASSEDNSFGALKLGPDGRIYVARPGNFLDAIKDPNAKAPACKYIVKAVSLSPASCNFGLPNTYLTAKPEHDPPKIQGKIPVPVAEPPVVFDCDKVIEKPFTKSGQMTMTDISVCEAEYMLSAKNFGASFAWSNLASTQKITVSTSGIYRVEIRKGGCSVTDSLRVRFRKDNAVFSFLPTFDPEAEFLSAEFYYEIDDVHGFELKVFGKRRNVLFETTNFKKKWNGKNPKGKLVPAGKYAWTVKYIPNCPKDSKQVTQSGQVTVKRTKK